MGNQDASIDSSHEEEHIGDQVGLQDGRDDRRFHGRAQERAAARPPRAAVQPPGADGWELAWILMEQSLHGEKDGHVVIFKRPLPAGSVPATASESPTAVFVPEVASTAS